MNEQPAGSFEIHCEVRGPHWVAWISRPGEQVPHESILLVGATRREAEDKARLWAARVTAQAARTPSST